MKKLLTLLIALQLSMVFIGFQGFEGVLAQNAPGAAPPAPAALSADCNTTLGTTATRDTNFNAAENTPSNDVIVLLTEAIETGDESASCGKIIECLRIYYGPLKSLADAKVIADLKKNYSQCIVSGKDGLDLLNNYAGLVYRWIAGIVGAICILMIIISGIQISMGGLSQEEVSTAKDRIVRSLTGMVVLFLSAFILYTINPIFFT